MTNHALKRLQGALAGKPDIGPRARFPSDVLDRIDEMFRAMDPVPGMTYDEFLATQEKLREAVKRKVGTP